MTNEQQLNEVYKRITALEMVEKLKSCGIVWNQVNSTQFSATFEQGSSVWDIFITNNISDGRIVIDFRKDMRFFYSMDSSQEPDLSEMFEEINEDDYRKDRALLYDITQMRDGCFEVYNIVMNGGALGNGIARVNASYTPTPEDGGVAGGQAEESVIS